MKVIVIGMGYIGLPTAALIASKNISVTGIDINADVVDIINQGKIHIVEPDLDDTVKNVVNSGYLNASTDPLVGDVYLIVVPTPFKDNYEPDTSYIESATESILPFLKEGDLYIIESTSPIGTTEKMAELIFSRRPELKKKLYIAYCPERVLPGNTLFELVNNDRVLGGIDDKSTQEAVSFYSRFVKGNLHKTNSKTAEMCKLVENASRDVQIAFANELDIICNKVGINTWELIELANKHPRVNILQPGCGVGGHCIAVDPYFLFKKFPDDSKLMASAREINDEKPNWCVNQIMNHINDFEKMNNKKPKISICGLTYKPDVDDLRESPAIMIASQIKKIYSEERIYFVEPNINEHSNFVITSYEEAVKNSDIIFYLVNHSSFREINVQKETKQISFCSDLNLSI